MVADMALLAAHGMTYGYQRAATILDNFTWEFVAGRTTALTGPSGSGKSTLLYLLAGLLTPRDGTVCFQGTDLRSLPDHQRSTLRAKRFGFVFQDFALDPRRTVLDSVLEPALYADERRSDLAGRACELLDRMGVQARADARPGEISGGQAQRVATCRALLLSPAVIFADEPTGNLDHHSADVVLGALGDAAAAGSAVLVATHDDRIVERCDERVVLR